MVSRFLVDSHKRLPATSTTPPEKRRTTGRATQVEQHRATGQEPPEKAYGARESAMLDVADFTTNPAVPQLGRFGTLAVRYGKAMRGSPPRRRKVPR